MPSSSIPSWRHPPLSLPHTLIPLSIPHNSPFFFTPHNQTQQFKLLLLSTNSSQPTTSNAFSQSTQNERPYPKEKGISKLHVQELVNRIKSLSATQKDDPSEAEKVLDLMIGTGFQPNVAIFTEVINSFCKRGRLQLAYEVFEVMSKVGCEPTINTYNCLLKGLCYVGRVEEAYELLMNIKKSSKKPDIYTYTAVMDGFCKVGRSNEALELLEEALEMGLTPNAVTFNTLFNGYFKEGRPLEGLDLLKQMKERDSNCMPDYISYSTLLFGLLKWGETRAALMIYKEMVAIGFEVDERMMNTLLRQLCRRSRKEKDLLKDAYQVFDKMINSSVCVIYPVTHELVVEAFCLGKEMDNAVMNLGEMIRLGYSPKSFTFNNVIRVLCGEGKLEEALWVLVVLYGGSSRIPDGFGFNILINEFNRQGKIRAAGVVYGAALKRGVVPVKKPTDFCASI